MIFGFAIGPMSRATWARSSSCAASPAAPSTTKAATACPVIGSETPVTPASPTAGCATSDDSISIVERRWPDTFTTSSRRPRIQMQPSASMVAPSPAT
jgi:hypothetical protein